MLSNYDCLKQVIEKSLPIEIIIEKDEDRLVINELIAWHKKFQSKPAGSKIEEKLNLESHDKCLIFKNRLLELNKVEAKVNEFPYFLEQLKHYWATKQVEEKVKTILIPDKPYLNLESYSKAVKDLSAGLHSIHNSVVDKSYCGESFTTLNASENIEMIKTRDTSAIRRYHTGHDPLDEATGGFMPGEILMVVANVNQGKSMALANFAYHMWYHDKANILILTAEMQPEMFDDRIYSRASQVEYSHILAGKTKIGLEEIQALDVTVKEMKSRENQIIVRWLENSDNVNTVAKVIDDYEKIHNFIPDVLIIDSLECLTPAKESKEGDWRDKGQIVEEFKNFAETFRSGRKLLVISTHQAKTITAEKDFKDIDITDIGRSKIVAEKADAAIYLRCREDLRRMQIKTIKARRFDKNLSWNMGYDFSRVLITKIENDSILPQ